MPKETLHFVITGGTLDAYWDGTKDTVVTNKESVLPQFIKNLKLYNNAVFTQVCMKDSRSLNKEDLRNILKAIEESNHKKIIVTLGTYTMPDTAKFLKNELKRQDQTIVFTGSLIPLAGFSISDAPFALGYAVSEVQHLEPGVYVCMNGNVFSPDEVVKFVEEGRFVSIFNR